MDFITFAESVIDFEVDVNELIECVGDGLKKSKLNDEVTPIVFECVVSISIGDLSTSISDFVENNWDEPYYQGQATVFVLSLVSPFKGQILNKLKQMPQLAKHFNKFNKLAQKSNIDDIIALSRRLDESILNLADDAIELTPKIRTALNSLESTADGRRYLDVIIHGEGNKFIIDGTSYDVGELADIIKQVNTDNLDVRLLSCSDLESAKELAQQIDGKLIANEGITRIHSDGKISAVSKTDGSPVEWKEIDNTGEITGSAGKHDPNAVNDDFVELGGSGSIKIGNEIGSGGNKIVYEIVGEPDKVIAVIREGKPISAIEDEIKLLDQISAQGMPTVEIIRRTTFDGRPALIMKKYEQGSKEIVKIVKGKAKIVGSSPYLNQNSIRYLQQIKRILIDKKIQINDLQFLIGKDGRVVIADPLDVYLNTAPNTKNKGMIDKLIEVARNN